MCDLSGLTVVKPTETSWTYETGEEVIHMGTMDSSAFRSHERADGKTDVLFNGPGDGANHGHVVEQTDAGGNRTYDYVRDVEGNTYIDNR